MRTLVLALIVTLAACGAHAPPQHPTNQATYFAGTQFKTAPACLAVSTASADQPDAAICSAGGRYALWCWSGKGAGSDCVWLVAPPPPAKQDGQGAPQSNPPAPGPTVPPVATPPPPSSPPPTPPAAGEAKKPEPAKPAKGGGK